MMMPPPTRVHQQVASNLAFELNTHFRAHRPEICALQEVGLIVPKAELFRPEADVAVLDPMADYESYADKFYCVAEILSDSNTDKDIAVKRQRYLQHPDNLYFLLIDQKRVRAEVFARAADWQPATLEGLDAKFELPAFGFGIELARSTAARRWRGLPERRAGPLLAIPSALRTRSRSWRRSARRRCRSPCR